MTIEIPDLESQSHVVEGNGGSGTDSDVEERDGGKGMGEEIQVDDGGDEVVTSGRESMEPHWSGQQLWT